MAETTILNGNLRTNTGKGFARASRRAGRIPAIIYGDKQDTISIDIEEREYKKKSFYMIIENYIKLMKCRIGITKSYILLYNKFLYRLFFFALSNSFIYI